MKRLLLMSSLLCLSGVGFAQNADAPKPAPPKLIFRLPEEDTKTPRNYDMLTAAVGKPIVNGSEAVIFKFTIRNSTDKVLAWGPSSRSVFRDYQIRVHRITTDKQRNEILNLAPLTEYGKAALSPFRISSGWFTNLKAGEATQEIRIAINRYFDMTLPGTYSITVHKHAGLGVEMNGYATPDNPDTNEHIVLASHPIRVEVQ